MAEKTTPLQNYQRAKERIRSVNFEEVVTYDRTHIQASKKAFMVEAHHFLKKFNALDEHIELMEILINDTFPPFDGTRGFFIPYINYINCMGRLANIAATVTIHYPAHGWWHMGLHNNTIKLAYLYDKRFKISGDKAWQELGFEHLMKIAQILEEHTPGIVVKAKTWRAGLFSGPCVSTTFPAGLIALSHVD